MSELAFIVMLSKLVWYFLQNYLFALLTGYTEPPAGVKVPDGMHYNPYFPGGLISMARALYDEILEYDDGKIAKRVILSNHPFVNGC